jgi:hypothetical protein
MKKTWIAVVVVLMLAGIVWAAENRVRQATVYNAITGAEAVGLLSKEGYQPKLKKADDGDPQITFKLAGKTIYLDFYDCNKSPNCGSLNLSTGWALEKKLDLKKLNTWNADNRYIRVYTDKDNDPYLEADKDLDGGATLENVKEFVKLYASQLDDFVAEFKLR